MLCSFKISKYGQYIDFNAPVFADSVKVYLISTGINDVQLSLDEDFVIPEEFVSSCDHYLATLFHISHMLLYVHISFL